jgi:hypothetical protein
MRTKVNELCNLLTGEDSNSPRGLPQITVPHLRLRMYAAEAERLGRALLEAAGKAREAEAETETCDFCGKPADELGEVEVEGEAEGKLMCVPCYEKKGEEMARALEEGIADLEAGGDPGKYLTPAPARPKAPAAPAGLEVYVKAAGERGEWVSVASVAQARALCRSVIDTNGLGATQWQGGAIRRGKRKVARLSYNGRLWEPKPYPQCRELNDDLTVKEQR